MTGIEFEIKSSFNKEQVSQSQVNKLKSFLFDVMTSVHGDAVIHAPVDTGFLKANIKLKPKKPALKIKVESNAKYSSILEYGNSKQKSQPYLRPALRKVMRVDVPKLRKKYKLD